MVQDRKIHLCVPEDAAESQKLSARLGKTHGGSSARLKVVVNSAFVQGRLYHSATAINLDVQIRFPVG